MAIRNLLNSSESFLESISKPLIIYSVFLIALICYNLTQGDVVSMGKNFVFLAMGSILIWILCFLGYEPVAWVLIFLPIFFVVALLALLVLTQIVNTEVNFSNNKFVNITGSKLKDWFGFNDRATEDAKLGITHDYTTGFFPPKHPVATCNRQERVQELIPTISSAKRIAQSKQAAIPEKSISDIPVMLVTCDTCE
jgi:energy-coupling factor transporter transmembrane protein EcfT